MNSVEVLFTVIVYDAVVLFVNAMIPPRGIVLPRGRITLHEI
jgi:hypothetical protein